MFTLSSSKVALIKLTTSLLSRKQCVNNFFIKTKACSGPQAYRPLYLLYEPIYDLNKQWKYLRLLY